MESAVFATVTHSGMNRFRVCLEVSNLKFRTVNIFTGYILTPSKSDFIITMESAAPAKNGLICASCQGPGKSACSGCLLVVVRLHF